MSENSAESVESLEHRRRIIIQKFERLGLFFNDLTIKYEDQIPDEDAIESLNSRLEKVDPLWYEFNDLQTGIELPTPDRAAENEEARAKLEDLYFDIVSPIKNMLKKHLHQFNPASEAGSHAPAENNVKSRVSFQPSVELEPIKIPKFHGDYNS
ncbi:hypothetical protein JTB14_026358 [Gonioctena quinquepunctata]|nr:hypothetical protein JTB14_026358 [Gonioctena quinquepunctata]